ncbi:hypothetical protein POCGH01_06011500 [Plasmodium ovale]|uniref:Uncharacterized protein n=2 Tax=Plasmodium ovale TaxID=36330 RepID=A0A1D3TFW8_PLAOA|nr:hypothetical protein POCGH01_06011500 [Plasmodium ovale]
MMILRFYYYIMNDSKIYRKHFKSCSFYPTVKGKTKGKCFRKSFLTMFSYKIKPLLFKDILQQLKDENVHISENINTIVNSYLCNDNSEDDSKDDSWHDSGEDSGNDEEKDDGNDEEKDDENDEEKDDGNDEEKDGGNNEEKDGGNDERNDDGDNHSARKKLEKNKERKHANEYVVLDIFEKYLKSFFTISSIVVISKLLTKRYAYIKGSKFYIRNITSKNGYIKKEDIFDVLFK